MLNVHTWFYNEAGTGCGSSGWRRSTTEGPHQICFWWLVFNYPMNNNNVFSFMLSSFHLHQNGPFIISTSIIIFSAFSGRKLRFIIHQGTSHRQALSNNMHKQEMANGLETDLCLIYFFSCTLFFKGSSWGCWAFFLRLEVPGTWTVSIITYNELLYLVSNH